MIRKIHIQNFKSIYDLEINVGRVNLFIGENGSGKSNLLEALVFLSAGQSNKLDNEFLVSRGLRVPESALMKSAFEEKSQANDIAISVVVNTEEYKCTFSYDEKSDYPQWGMTHNHQTIKMLNEEAKRSKERIEFLESMKEHFKGEIPKSELLTKQFEESIELVKEELKLVQKIDQYDKFILKFSFPNFLIYSPENTALRTFEREGQILPLGINGEGLLKLLKVVNNYEDKSYIQTIIKSLQLFNWFENITIPTDLSSMENKVIITDKYLYREIDQRSANEGFLFILFYITLIVAKETPKTFAIDNIDASLNPKLCTKLMTIIADLAKKYDKQIFLTTHNPAILDGIDLNDEEQKLFVVSRNDKGHTQMKKITVEDNPKDEDGESLHLSEAFLRGYLGGLPRGF